MTHLLVMLLITASFMPASALAAADASTIPDLTSHTIGYLSLIVFFLAYVFVILEERIHLRKSKPVLLAAGIIWALVAWFYATTGHSDLTGPAVRHTLQEYGEMMLFMLVAMTYINSMQERQVFEALRAWMLRKGFTYRTMFWLIGALAFLIAPIADNITTALLMVAVIRAVGGKNHRFVLLSCIAMVVSANAGGCFSPFGDLTTLMVWQAGKASTLAFSELIIPGIINYLCVALVITFMIPKGRPETQSITIPMRRGAIQIILLFLLTVVTAVLIHTYLHLPAALGMMIGLGYLQLYGYYMQKTQKSWHRNHASAGQQAPDIQPFDVFNRVARAEWDTLLFFYGVMMCIGGLGQIGYLAHASEFLYNNAAWDTTTANLIIGILAALVDNIPVMYAVLTMNPDMDQMQWLLVTFTIGTGGSLLSIGSAAGVAIMGQARGIYTFTTHLKWAPLILVGYFVGSWTHILLNQYVWSQL